MNHSRARRLLRLFPFRVTPFRFRSLRLAPALAAAVIGAAVAAGGCGDDHVKTGKQVVVLGFDGMDYEIARQMMAEGRMPNFAKVAARGTFAPLETSVPPQSPVAWSNFITGLDGGGHGIFDFIHRDPKTMLPELSTSRAAEPEKFIKLGRYQFPLDGGDVELLRRGTPFWEVLEERGVETTIIRMPANFPPTGTATRELSGMGTPDVVGTSGTFSFYTTDLFTYYGRDISGGEVYEIFLEEGFAEASLYGPDNPFLIEPEKIKVDFTIHVDPEQPVAKILLEDGQEILLEAGEWSDWVGIAFPLIPSQSLAAECRFYLKRVRPELELYVTPINFDPIQPGLPISTPEDFAAELAEGTGRYYTQEMPEDTKALSAGIFDKGEFLVQAGFAGMPVIEQYDWILDRFDDGLLFYYFGNLDQVSHMMFRTLDPEHPAYDADADAGYATAVPKLYEQLDAVVGRTLERFGDDVTLFVMSDHGFASWRRVFDVNAWLRDEGYLTPRNPDLADDPGFLSNIDWSGTRAYGLGINGLYVNLRGRERDGIVAPEEREALMDEIAEKLLAVIDPATGGPAITRVYKREEFFRDRGHLEIGPDLVIGYAEQTRGSNTSAVGGIAREVHGDNTDAWSGDHCMDHETVPGILLTNQPLAKEAPSLKTLAAAVLAEFGVDEFPIRSGAEDSGVRPAG